MFESGIGTLTAPTTARPHSRRTRILFIRGRIAALPSVRDDNKKPFQDMLRHASALRSEGALCGGLTKSVMSPITRGSLRVSKRRQLAGHVMTADEQFLRKVARESEEGFDVRPCRISVVSDPWCDWII